MKSCELPALTARRSPRAILVPVALAAFVIAMDNTVLNVALPTIQTELGLSISGLEWVATSYILTFSSLLLVGGRLTDLYGRRRLFLLGMAVFIGSSVLAGMATTGGALIGARAVQGVGAALVMPATLAVLAADVDERARQTGAGVWTAAIALALALGPVVGGLVAEHWHWSGIFYLNVPVGALTMVMGARAIPAGPAADHGRRRRPGGWPGHPPWRRPAHRELDLAGLFTSAVALFAFTYALIQGHEHGYASFEVLLMFILAAAGTASFVAVERLCPQPMVDVKLFRHPVFAGGTAAQVLWGLGINGVFFFTSLFLQAILGFSPTQAGLAFVPVAVLLVLTVPVAALLASRAGAHWTVAAGLGLVAVGLVLVSRVGAGATYPALLPGLACIGVGSAFTTPLTSSVLSVTESGGAGMASAVVSAAREVSGVFGISLTGAILLARQNAELGAGASPPEAFLAGYSLGLQVAAALVGLGALVSAVALHPSVVAGAQRRLAPAGATDAPAATPTAAGVTAGGFDSDVVIAEPFLGQRQRDHAFRAPQAAEAPGSSEAPITGPVLVPMPFREEAFERGRAELFGFGRIEIAMLDARWDEKRSPFAAPTGGRHRARTGSRNAPRQA